MRQIILALLVTVNDDDELLIDAERFEHHVGC